MAEFDRVLDVNLRAMFQVLRSAPSRMGECDEVATAFHFLAADDSSYVTGADIVVDGGFLAGLAPQLDAPVGWMQG